MRKRYLITGATGAIGGAIARALDERGDDLVALVRTGVGRAVLPPRAHVVVVFPALGCGSAEAEARIATGGAPFDGIIHCAGAMVHAPLAATDSGRWADAMTCAEIALGLLRAASRRSVLVDGGAVLMLSSAAAHRATAGLGAYAAGKAAVEALCKAAAVELAPRRIRVNCLAPGAVSGAMHDRLMARLPAGAGAAYEQRHPLGIAAPEQVAAAAVWLLDAQQITGAVVPLDGGLTV